MRRIRVHLLQVLLGVVAATALSVAAWAGGDYSLDFSRLTSDGAVSQVSVYEITDRLSLPGVDGQVQGSTNYSVTPPVEAEVSVVEQWMLY